MHVRVVDQKPTVLGENVGISVFSALAMIVMSLVSWTWLAPSSNSVAEAIERGWFASAGIGAYYLVLTSRVVATSSGTLEIANFLIVHRVPFGEVEEISSDHGLVIRLRGGRAVRSVVNSRSLAGERRSYPEAKATRERIEQHMKAAQPEGAVVAAEASSGIRWRALAAALALAVANLVVMMVIAST